MATKKKAAGSTKAGGAKPGKPAFGGELNARPPGVLPVKVPPPPKGKGKAKAPVGRTWDQVDPMYVYDIQVFAATTWIKIGEIWFSTSGVEYWGLYKDWSVWNVGPNLWIYPYAYATQYSSLTAFKNHVTAVDPKGDPSFLKITQTVV